MDYRDALHIGSKAEGIIKCTFATVYDEKGTGLFSLQRVKAQFGVDYKDGYSDETTKDDWILTQLTPNIYFADNRYGVNQTHDAELTGGITFDMPLVSVSEISSERLVPARMTAEAINIIKKACAEVRARKYIVYRTNTNPNSPSSGARAKVAETYNYQYAQSFLKKQDGYVKYDIETQNVIAPKYVKLSEILEQRGTVYVKPSAFDWSATDIREAQITDENGNVVLLSDALDAAAKKLAQAKALLAVAGASNIM